MEIPRKGIGVRLGLVVEDETRQIAPARIAAELDEPGPEHEAENQPAQKHHHDRRGRGASREWPGPPKRSQEDREKAGLEEQDLPAEAVEDLADVDERHVDQPEGEKARHVV